MGLGTALTKEERQLIIELLENKDTKGNGFSLRAIASHVSRSHTAVSNFINLYQNKTPKFIFNYHKFTVIYQIDLLMKLKHLSFRSALKLFLDITSSSPFYKIRSQYKAFKDKFPSTYGTYLHKFLQELESRRGEIANKYENILNEASKTAVSSLFSKTAKDKNEINHKFVAPSTTIPTVCLITAPTSSPIVNSTYSSTVSPSTDSLSESQSFSYISPSDSLSSSTSAISTRSSTRSTKRTANESDDFSLNFQSKKKEKNNFNNDFNLEFFIENSPQKKNQLKKEDPVIDTDSDEESESQLSPASDNNPNYFVGLSNLLLDVNIVDNDYLQVLSNHLTNDLKEYSRNDLEISSKKETIDVISGNTESLTSTKYHSYNSRPYTRQSRKQNIKFEAKNTLDYNFLPLLTVDNIKIESDQQPKIMTRQSKRLLEAEKEMLEQPQQNKKRSKRQQQ